jgi:hypothetical protein
MLLIFTLQPCSLSMQFSTHSSSHRVNSSAPNPAAPASFNTHTLVTPSLFELPALQLTFPSKQQAKVNMRLWKYTILAFATSQLTHRPRAHQIQSRSHVRRFLLTVFHRNRTQKTHQDCSGYIALLLLHSSVTIEYGFSSASLCCD